MKNIMEFTQFIKTFYNVIDEAGVNIDDEIVRKGTTMAQIDKDLEKSKEDNKDTCPRCNLIASECECDDKDYYSTKNIYKLQPGKEYKK